MAPGSNFVVDDPAALWTELHDQAVVVEPLFDTPYGTRKFTSSLTPMATSSVSSTMLPDAR